MNNNEVKDEFKTLLTVLTGQVGMSVPVVPEFTSAILARTFTPAITDLAKAEKTGGFEQLFRSCQEFPFFSEAFDGLRSVLTPLVDWLYSAEWSVWHSMNTEDFREHLKTAGKTAQDSAVALILRFVGWFLRVGFLRLRSFIMQERAPTPTEAKIQALLSEVKTDLGPTDLRFERTPFRALISSLAAEGRPFSSTLVSEHLESQIKLVRQAKIEAGLSIPQLGKRAGVSATTLRKLFGPNPSTGVTAGTLARVCVELHVPFLRITPSRLESPHPTRTNSDPVAEQAAEPVEGTNPVEDPVTAEPANSQPKFEFVESTWKPPLLGKLDPVDRRAMVLRVRAHEYIATTQALNSPDYMIDTEDPAMIEHTLMHYRRHSGICPADMPTIEAEDAYKYLLARDLWTGFIEWTGINQRLSIRPVERLIAAVDIAYAQLHSQESTTIALRFFGGNETGPKDLDATLTREQVRELTGVDTSKWPRLSEPKPRIRLDRLFDDEATIESAGLPKGASYRYATSEDSSPANSPGPDTLAGSPGLDTLAEIVRLREQLDCLTAKVNGRLTH